MINVPRVGLLVLVGAISLALILFSLQAYSQWIQMGTDLELANGRIALLQSASETNVKTIQDLQDQQLRDAAALTSLAEDLEAIRRKAGETQKAVKNLEVTDESVNTYLHQHVPDSLRRVLNNRTYH